MMTKKELLEMIDTSTLKFDRDKKVIYNKFFPLMKATLRFCPNDFELAPASSLAVWSDRKAFESYYKDTSIANLEDQFKAVLTDLNTLSEDFISKEPKYVRNSAIALAYGSEAAQKKRKRSRVVFIVFIALFILLSAATAVFAFLDNFGVIDAGNQIAGACGICDFVVGVGSVIYERIDDRRKQELGQEVEAAVNAGDASKLIPDYPQAAAAPVPSAPNINFSPDLRGAKNTTYSPTINLHVFCNSPEGEEIEKLLSELIEQNGEFAKAIESLKAAPSAAAAVSDLARDTRKILDSLQAKDANKANLAENAAILKKADRLADCCASYNDKCGEPQGGANLDLLLLRWQIYCNALRDEYNDLYNNKRTEFQFIKEYRNKLLAAGGESAVSASGIKELERRIKNVLRSDSEAVKREADGILEDFRAEQQVEDPRFHDALQRYFGAMRNEYNDICINKRTKFGGLKEVRGNLLGVASSLRLGLDESKLLSLEAQILRALRPDSETAKRKADELLQQFTSNITKN